jgi:hypothetical protein
MCSSTVAIVAPQKQRHAADLWDSPFSSSNGNADPLGDRADANVAIVDVQAFVLGFGISAAGEGGHATIERGQRGRRLPRRAAGTGASATHKRPMTILSRRTRASSSLLKYDASDGWRRYRLRVPSSLGVSPVLAMAQRPVDRPPASSSSNISNFIKHPFAVIASSQPPPARPRRKGR